MITIFPSRTLTFQKKLCYLLDCKPFKNDEKCYLLHLKSSFRSQDIQVFFTAFWSCRKNGQNSWRHNLVYKQLQYTYCPISHKVKATRQYSNKKYFSSKIMWKMRQGDQFQTSFYFLEKLNMRWKQVVCCLVLLYFDSLNLSYNKNELYNPLDYWSRDMLNFNFRGLRLVSPPHYVHHFPRKMFLMLHSMNWANFTVWLPLFLDILSNICINICIVC